MANDPALRAALEAPDAEEITTDSPGELSAAAAGRRLAAVVREAEASIRGSLTGHVFSTLDHFAFRHRGDPFPTLPPGEFLRRIDRLEAQLGQRPPVRA